ncbi:MAG: bifunctional folylpolyglutamate synthase/dihydrofolate synthase [bacterium]|nr:bifunctional folylpolyglutamate synthase/dihydrofolate synthase [bacterium]
MDPRARIETPEQAGRYLETLINLEKRPELTSVRMSLSPIRALLDRVGQPEQGMSILHVAGSKGKGSTCLFAEGALTAIGKRVGVFTSPHLHSWTERFRIAGCDVDGGALARAVSDLRPHIDWLRANEPENAPTFFDATTAAALLIFARAELDCVILEVGLGGRLDSTNVVEPRVSCITSIELEHTDKLGDTLGAIAREKAGIIKPGVPCLIGRLAPEAETVIRERAREVGAEVFALGLDFPAVDPGQIAVLGRHQADNAGLALAAVSALVGLEDPAVLEAARKGLAATRLPGRMEVLSEDPIVIVDGAHTRESARALAGVLAECDYQRGRLLLSVSGGKDLAAILDALLPHVEEVVVTRADPYRSLACEELAAAIRARGGAAAVREIPAPDEAAREILCATQPGELLVAAGSIYLAAAAREHWRKPTLAPG